MKNNKKKAYEEWLEKNSREKGRIAVRINMKNMSFKKKGKYTASQFHKDRKVSWRNHKGGKIRD